MPKKQIRVSLEEEIIKDLQVMGNGANYTAVVLAMYNLAKNTPGFDPFGAYRSKPVDETVEDIFNQE